MPPNTGTCAFQVGSETYHTWFQIVGDLRSTRTSGIRPLVVLHGGPGMSHHYMLPHTQLHGTHNIPVIFYDQIGNGASTHLPDKPPTFWTLDLFMDELDNLLQFLGVSGEFDLLGHSWGCMLAAHYASHRHPAGMRRLVLVSGAPSMKLWQEGANQLRDKLPKETRDMLEEHERDGTTGDQEYQDAMQAFSNKHICRLVPWPEELLTSFAIMEKEPIVYATMVGVSDFNITGTLKTWSCVDQLHTIACPTLITNGVHDEAQDVAFFEAPERYFDVLGDFLTGNVD